MRTEELAEILKKTDGRCHLCRKGRLSVQSYGSRWELDHSVPRAWGGTNRQSNLLPAHVRCNRSKQDRSTRSVRAENGFSKRPLSREEQGSARMKNTLTGAGVCAVVGGLLGGPPGALIGGALGCLLGHGSDVE